MLANMFRIICIISFGTFLNVSGYADIEQNDIGTPRNGCFHNGTLFANGSMVPTIEPCLSCSCNVNNLVCSLRICPEMPVPPPRGCVLVQRKTGCCPYLSCKRYHTQYDGPNRRIVAYLDHYERETIDRVVNDNVLQRRSDDSELDVTGEICILNGTVYKSGSAMSSSGLCTYCYCIGGVQKCVKPKCMLNMDGCKPIYVDSTCCPVRYDCSSKNAGIVKAPRFQIRSGNKHYLRVIGRTQRNRGCIINSTFYHEGQKLPADPERHCDICFCIKGSRKCTPKKCAPALKNCIPVVPKGQCCPSSYDCNNTREPGRQFDLFSLLFGAEKSNHVAATQTPQPPIIPLASFPTPPSVKSTTEKTIFDAIREGLEFIDNNESTVADVLKKLNVLNETTSSTTASSKMSAQATLEKEDTQEDENIGLLDIILGSDQTNKTEETAENTSNGGNETISEEENVSKLEEAIDSTTEDPTSTISDISTTEETTETTTGTSEYPLDSEDEYLYGSTTEEDTSEPLTGPGNESDIEDANEHLEDEIEEEIPTTTYQPKESVSSDEVTNSTEKTVSSTVVESKHNSIDILASTSAEFSITTVKSRNNGSNETSNETIDEQYSTTSTNEQSTKPTTEAGGDFLSVFFDGLSKILEPSQNKTKPAKVTNSSLSSTSESPVNITITTTEVNLSANKTSSLSTVEIPTTTPTTTTVSTTPLNALTPQPAELPIVIKTNPSILESDYNLDYSDPTLPPSLPNLKIIPFLPTDAVKNDRKHMYNDYYGKLKSTSGYPSITEKHESWGQLQTAGKNSISKIDYDLGYDHTGSYPSITEAYDETAGEHHKYSFSSFEYPDVEQDELKDKFESPVAVPVPAFDTFVKTDEPPVVNRFSPPTKTEGGFVPKSPLPDLYYYDNLHTTKFLIDLTTAVPKPLTTNGVLKIASTTADPFKDVIKTEPPPDLSSLIEDKEKLLASGAPSNLFAAAGPIDLNAGFEKEIISITTDATYNYTSEYKDAKDDFEVKVSSNITLTLDDPDNSSSTSLPVLIQGNTTSESPLVLITGPSVKINKTTNSQSNAEDTYDYESGLESVLDVFFKSETKNISFEGVPIPPFKTLPPANTKYELIKTYKPGTEPGGLDSSDSVEDLGILKDALQTGYQPNDSEKYKPPSRTDAPITSKPEVASFLSEPFNKLPFIKQSFQVKPTKDYHYDPLNPDLDLMLHTPDDLQTRNNFNVEGYKILSNDPIIAQTDSYVVNPVDITKLKQQQSVGGAQVFTKPDTSNSINDPAGILKLAGCNIYGRMYRVGRIISELSGPCLECKCTEVGVNCAPLSC